jgi:excisionase family DNA binding protein
MNRNQNRRVYTVEEVAQLIGVARSTMYELVRTKQVASVRVGRRLFVQRVTVEELIGFTPPLPADLGQRG